MKRYSYEYIHIYEYYLNILGVFLRFLTAKCTVRLGREKYSTERRLDGFFMIFKYHTEIHHTLQIRIYAF